MRICSYALRITQRDKQVSKPREQWEENALKPALARSSERKATFETAAGVPVERLYTPDDVADLDYERDLGYPGQPPYTRGVQPTMYRGRLWTMRQYAGYGTAQE